MTLDVGTQLLVMLLLDDLIDALKHRDAEAATDVIDHIAAVAGRDIADRILREIILIGLASMVRRPGNPDNGSTSGGDR